LKEILVGLILGDLYIKKETNSKNVRLCFMQGTIHTDYLSCLYEKFSSYCGTAPKIRVLAPDKRTGKIYSSIYFNTYSLPCLNYLYDLFYPDGTKVVPKNIEELLTPLGLAYLICDDGSYNQGGVYLNTQSYTKAEVELLAKVLTDKFNLKCTIT
jgi:hypothetical protein